MQKYFFFSILIFASIAAKSQPYTVSSPNGKTVLKVSIETGTPFYSVHNNDVVMLEKSPLGLKTNIGDFSRDMKFVSSWKDTINNKYQQDKIKKSFIHYKANALKLELSNKDSQKIVIVFQVSNNNIGFRYKLPQQDEFAGCIIEKELTGFNFPDNTTTFLSPQATPGIGWKNTKPSYEEEYVPDEKLSTSSKYGLGYTFPSLFHMGDNGWLLISETGVSSAYCGSRLSEGSNEGIYSIAYPEPGENNSFGSAFPSISLPGSTPWRTITMGDNLKPIVETTIPFDLVEPLYEPSQKYKYGRSTWSWIMWQDWSMNYDDQVTYIDLAAEMGYEYILIDALWRICYY